VSQSKFTCVVHDPVQHLLQCSEQLFGESRTSPCGAKSHCALWSGRNLRRVLLADVDGRPIAFGVASGKRREAPDCVAAHACRSCSRMVSEVALHIPLHAALNVAESNRPCSSGPLTSHAMLP
jgi:hypothetical protein